MANREQVVKVAEKYVAKGKLDAAIKEYLKVLKENPNDVSTLNRLGDLYARTARIDEAVRLFTQIAQQYTEDGFLVKAIAIYKKIIKLDPTRLQVYESLAGLYHRQGLVNEARTQYQVLGDYYLKHNDGASAINIFVKMGELEPDNPSHHLRLAELYQQGKLWDKALRSYRTIAELMLQHDRVEEAVRVFQRAIEVHAEDLGFITDAVTLLADGGHDAAALKLLAHAVALNPQAERVARTAGMGRRDAEELEAAPPPETDAARSVATAPQAPGAQTPAAEPPKAEAPPAAEPAAPPPRRRRAEDELFAGVDEDLPSSLVSPPPGFDQPGSAFDPGAWSPRTTAPSDDASGSFTFELPDLEVPELDAAAPAPAAGAAGPASSPSGADESVELPDDLVSLPWQDEPVPVETPSGEASEEIELELDLSDLELEEAPAPGASLEPAASMEVEEPALEFELDLDEPFSEVAPPAPSPAAPPAPAARAWPAPVAPMPPPEATPPAAPEPPRLQDLLAEAEVFARYGLEEKALERLDQVLAGDPRNLDALQLLLDLQLKRGDGARGQATAERIRRAAAARGLDDVWQRAQARLARAGLQPTGGATAPRSETDERLSRLVESLGGGAPARPAPKRRSPVDDALADIAAGVREKRRPTAPGSAPAETARRPPAAASPPSPPAVAPVQPPGATPPAARPPRPGLVEGIEEELPGIVLPEERPAAAARPSLDDTGMEWLREEPKPAASAGPDKLFDDEEDFFDLAAELEEELGVEEGRVVGKAHAPQEEPTLEQIVEGFKKGVAENLSPEDYDTHYNLGIAYREMGLLDEAIGEFQLAAKDPAHLVDCCSMLGVSFLEKGLPELAVKWYQRGLTAPDLKEEVMLSLLYDMGEVYAMMGDAAAARKTFVELYGISSNYRDVVAKLEELGR